jgi:hypothetical protein
MILDAPLYAAYEVKTLSSWNGFIRSLARTLDAYCLGCENHSVFHPDTHDATGSIRDHRFYATFACARDQSHTITAYFELQQGILRKIGQVPALADMATADIQKYRKGLKGDGFKELSRGIGLTTHGIGIGSFVYIRRVLERLVEEAHSDELKQNKEWDEEAFQKLRIGERIQLLNERLPDFLVENTLLLGILGKGIHELSEEECLTAFPTVRLAVELILDARIESASRAGKLAKVRQEIQGVSERLRERESGSS